MKDMDMRILEMLKDHTIKNARTAAHYLWKECEGWEGAAERSIALTAAIDRCESGKGTYEDWELLAEEVEL